MKRSAAGKRRVDTSGTAESTMTAALHVVVAFDAVVFLLAAMLHVGIAIPLGNTVITTDQIAPASVVEGLLGLVFTFTTYAVYARKGWSWPLLTGAHIMALAGVLLGIWAIAEGYGPDSLWNDIYHRVMLVILVAGLIALFTPSGRTALGRDNQRMPPYAGNAESGGRKQ